MKKALFLSLFALSLFGEEPWGKDQDLAWISRRDIECIEPSVSSSDPGSPSRQGSGSSGKTGWPTSPNICEKSKLARISRTVTPPRNETCQTPFFGPLAEKAIWLRQNVLAPADGPRSNFRPSSSQYALDSIRKYGFFKGFLLGCDRLMRENDDNWVYHTILLENGEKMKWDPVK